MIRAAIRSAWPQAQHLALSQLGDETLAAELMEVAIQQTAEHLADSPPIEAHEAQLILARFYRNAVRRKKRSDQHLVYRGTAQDIEFLLPPVESFENAVEAEVDLATILDETPEDVRHAMLMRFGARSSWMDVAKETTKSLDAIRMGCRREMSRIRKRFGFLGRDSKD